jgi:hypothetical protein
MKSIPQPARSISKVIGQRLSGSKPGVFEALLTSIAAGVAVGVITYRLQRGGG